MSTIILLEDDTLLSELYALHLSQAGHEVIQGRNSRDIVALVQTHRPALVITDLIMPDHEGIEGIFRLQHMAALPLIAISSNPEFLMMARSLVSATLLKPFSGETLARLAGQLLAGAQP